MATSALAAAALRAEREIIEHLRQRRATTAASAVPLPELRPIGRRRLERLVDAQVVRPGLDGYFLDEGLYDSYRADRRAAIMAAVAAAIALAGGIWLGQRAL